MLHRIFPSDLFFCFIIVPAYLFETLHSNPNRSVHRPILSAVDINRSLNPLAGFENPVLHHDEDSSVRVFPYTVVYHPQIFIMKVQ